MSFHNQIVNACANRPKTIQARVFLKRWDNADSMPVQLRCSDKREYVVKGKNAGRVMVNDQVIARLGCAMGAPVGEAALVEISPELIEIEPAVAHLGVGVAHGTLVIPNCGDRTSTTYCDEGDNMARFALLSVLYGWCHANDQQVIYETSSPHLVYSVDHGHFLPNGPNWNAISLGAAKPAMADVGILNACNIGDHLIYSAVGALKNVRDEQIFEAVAAPPDDWGMTMIERILLAGYFIDRRNHFSV